MPDVTTNVDAYLSAYGEPDRDRRAALIAQGWTDDVRLIDPPLTGEGHDGISDMAEAVQQQFPGHRFRRSSGVDVHHGHLRFAWELVGPDGTAALSGLDVGELADDGRLRRVVGWAARPRRPRPRAGPAGARPRARRARALPGARRRRPLRAGGANRAVALFTGLVAAHLLEPPVNVLRLALHPDGLAPHIVNLGQWRAHLLERLARLAAASGDGALASLHAELLALPGGAVDGLAGRAGDEIALPLRLSSRSSRPTGRPPPTCATGSPPRRIDGRRARLLSPPRRAPAGRRARPRAARGPRGRSRARSCRRSGR